jgi:hypothetical protein
MKRRQPVVLDYTSIGEDRPWPVRILAVQLLIPVLAAVLARIVSNHLHSDWGPGYPNRSQILEHARLAEDVPFSVGAGLLLAATAIGVMQGVRGKSRWWPVVVCAPIAFAAMLFAIMLAVPYY